MLFLASAASAQSNAFCTTLYGLENRTSDSDLTLVASELFPESNLGTPHAEHQGDCKVSSSDQYALTCTWQLITSAFKSASK